MTPEKRAEQRKLADDIAVQWAGETGWVAAVRTTLPALLDEVELLEKIVGDWPNIGKLQQTETDLEACRAETKRLQEDNEELQSYLDASWAREKDGMDAVKQLTADLDRALGQEEKYYRIDLQLRYGPSERFRHGEDSP